MFGFYLYYWLKWLSNAWEWFPILLLTLFHISKCRPNLGPCSPYLLQKNEKIQEMTSSFSKHMIFCESDDLKSLEYWTLGVP